MVGVRVANGPHIGAGICVAFADIVGDADSGVLLCTAGSSAFIFCDWGDLLRFSSFGGPEPSPAFPLAARTSRMYVTKKGSHVHFTLTGFVITLVVVQLWFVFGGGPDLDVSCRITPIGLVRIQFEAVFAVSFCFAAVPLVHSGAEWGATRAVELVSLLRLPSSSF